MSQSRHTDNYDTVGPGVKMFLLPWKPSHTRCSLLFAFAFPSLRDVSASCSGPSAYPFVGTLLSVPPCCLSQTYPQSNLDPTSTNQPAPPTARELFGGKGCPCRIYIPGGKDAFPSAVAVGLLWSTARITHSQNSCPVVMTNPRRKQGETANQSPASRCKQSILYTCHSENRPGAEMLTGREKGGK